MLYAFHRTDHPFGLVFGRLRIGVNRRYNDFEHLENVGALVEEMLDAKPLCGVSVGGGRWNTRRQQSSVGDQPKSRRSR